jgi:hypothetical protein
MGPRQRCDVVRGGRGRVGEVAREEGEVGREGGAALRRVRRVLLEEPQREALVGVARGAGGGGQGEEEEVVGARDEGLREWEEGGKGTVCETRVDEAKRLAPGTRNTRRWQAAAAAAVGRDVSPPPLSPFRAAPSPLSPRARPRGPGRPRPSRRPPPRPGPHPRAGRRACPPARRTTTRTRTRRRPRAGTRVRRRRRARRAPTARRAPRTTAQTGGGARTSMERARPQGVEGAGRGSGGAVPALLPPSRDRLPRYGGGEGGEGDWQQSRVPAHAGDVGLREAQGRHGRCCARRWALEILSRDDFRFSRRTGNFSIPCARRPLPLSTTAQPLSAHLTLPTSLSHEGKKRARSRVCKRALPPFVGIPATLF